MMAERTLTLRELNRATLARQFLLERTSRTPLEVLRRLVGMQAQNHNAPYIGLWTRLQSFQRAELTALLENRQVVKASLMRSTLHLMAADDYVAFRLALQPAMTSDMLKPFFGKTAQSLESEQFTSLLRAYIQESPRTSAELLARFCEYFPGLGTGHLNDAIRAQIPLVQIPPSGTWGFTGKPAHTEATTWLARPLDEPAAALRPLLKRYLAAFGPASIKDMQFWSGLNKLQQVIDTLRPELLTFHDEQGRELFDLPDAPRPAAETAAPVRLLSVFDNLLLAHADRQRVMGQAERLAVFTKNGLIRSVVLIDGFVRGIWKTSREHGKTMLLIELFEQISDQCRQALLAEGTRFMHWLLDGADTFEIQLLHRPLARPSA
jgi:hypothetical protein